MMPELDQEGHTMAHEAQNQRPERVRDTGALVLAVGGVAAAFGAASCCALPLLLGSLGLGSAWLVAVAWLAAPHRVVLLSAAIVCLVGGVAMFIWRRRVAAGTPGVACGSAATAAFVVGVLSLGTVLVVLGFMYA
jgi:mercuric ion transport protein